MSYRHHSDAAERVLRQEDKETGGYPRGPFAKAVGTVWGHGSQCECDGHTWWELDSAIASRDAIRAQKIAADWQAALDNRSA